MKDNNRELFDTQKFFQAETDDEFAAFTRKKKKKEPIQGEVLEDTGKFEFDFEKYNDQAGKDQQLGKSNYKFSNKGIRAFSLVMIFVLMVATVFFAGFGIYKILGGGNETNQTEENLFSSQGLELRDTPSSGDDSSPLNETNAKQAIANVSPSVVGIVGYSEKAGLKPDMYGSGVIVDSGGYIVTNASVVDYAMELKVILSNNEEYTASKIGVDYKTDLAVIKIDARNLATPEFGKSTNLALGEELLVVANPVNSGRNGVALQGIVSAIGMPIENYGAYSVSVIGVDAGINSETTGGALVNMYGQVVGVVSARLTEESGVSGVAISMNDVNMVIQQLQQHGRVTGRISLGVSLVGIDDMSSSHNNLPTGAYISTIDAESNLFKKGARQGDIITHINNNEIKSVKDLEKQFENSEPGHQMGFRLVRTHNSSQEQRLEISIELEEE